jgi:uncharacterized membrane protein YqjE
MVFSLLLKEILHMDSSNCNVTSILFHTKIKIMELVLLLTLLALIICVFVLIWKLNKTIKNQDKKLSFTSEQQSLDRKMIMDIFEKLDWFGLFDGDEK